MTSGERLFTHSLPALQHAFKEYSKVAVPHCTPEKSQIFGELRRRINQADSVLTALLSRIDQMKLAAIQSLFQAPPGTPESEAAFEATARQADENILLTEMFYWVAHRTRNVINKPLKDHSIRLPGMQGKMKSEGVTNVRSHLMEHPPMLDEQFSLGGEIGPKLRGSSRDKGLYLNAIEWAEELTGVLDRASKLLEQQKAD